MAALYTIAKKWGKKKTNVQQGINGKTQCGIQAREYFHPLKGMKEVLIQAAMRISPENTTLLGRQA